jgi:hypothetical protein
VGTVAYKLKLSESSSIHPVFHVSQLKQVVGSSVVVSDEVPQMLDELQFPAKLLQHRLVNRRAKTVLQVLVQWSSAPESLATWEDKEALHQHFPKALVWGQSGSLGGGGGGRCQNRAYDGGRK